MNKIRVRITKGETVIRESTHDGLAEARVAASDWVRDQFDFDHIDEGHHLYWDAAAVDWWNQNQTENPPTLITIEEVGR